MSTNAGSVADLTLQKFIDACIACVQSKTGSLPAAAPNAFKDSAQKIINPTETSEFYVEFRTCPGGTSATMKVRALGSRAQSIEGAVDIATLATKLA